MSIYKILNSPTLSNMILLILFLRTKLSYDVSKQVPHTLFSTDQSEIMLPNKFSTTPPQHRIGNNTERCQTRTVSSMKGFGILVQTKNASRL